MALPAERITIQNDMHARCNQHPGWASLDQQRRNALIRRIERSCCTAVIKSCERDGIDRLFSDKRFRDRYSACTSRVLTCFGEESSLIDRILDGSIDCQNVAGLDDVELCPDASKKERDMIERRRNQKIIPKTSRRYKCYKCGHNETIPADNHTRAADEASTRSIKCVKCEHVRRV